MPNSGTQAGQADELRILWESSRAGARAGRGFRFQDAVIAATLVDEWCAANACEITPESFDDYTFRSAGRHLFVQVKSKIAPNASFTRGDIFSALQKQSAVRANFKDEDPAITGQIIIDRPIVGMETDAEPMPISDITELATPLRQRLIDLCGEVHEAETALEQTSLLAMDDPRRRAVRNLRETKSLAPVPATLIYDRVLALVGHRTDTNAHSGFDECATISTSDVDRIYNELLDVADPEAMEASFASVDIAPINFTDPLPADGFYRGVAVRPGHVVARLVVARPDDVETIIGGLFDCGAAIIAGPSGSGKSGCAYLAAHTLRHAGRWFDVTPDLQTDEMALLRFIRLQSPSPNSPIFFILDDAGRKPPLIWSLLLREVQRHPGLYLLATVREEDLVLLQDRDRCTVHRPMLTETVAEIVWRNLLANKETTWAHWREPFEQSNGLLLEFVHILTEGERLRDLITAQVQRRLDEKRDNEFELLRLSCAATSLGADIDGELARAKLGLSRADYARAFSRLVDEHLISEVGASRIGGLHDLRSNAIFEICIRLAGENVSSARLGAISVVTPPTIHRFLASGYRTQSFKADDILPLLSERIFHDPDPALFTGILSGLDLMRLDQDADTFKALADEQHLTNRQYFMALLIMRTPLSNDHFAEGHWMSGILHMREVFAKTRTPDYRMDFLGALSASNLVAIVSRAEDLNEAQALLTALYGLDLSEDRVAPLHELVNIIRHKPILKIASFLGNAIGVSDALATYFVDALGGSDVLLDQLWRETPWASKPAIIQEEYDSRTLQFDLLAVTPPLTIEPDKTIFDFATNAHNLCPSVAQVTCRPVQITGEPIEIDGFTPGLKSLRKESIHSPAEIVQNRMLLHTVALKYGGPSLTACMKARKEMAVLAAERFTLLADRFCRRRRLTPKLRHELQALRLLDDLTPGLPLLSPELALTDPMQGDFSDSAGAILTDIISFAQRLFEKDRKGFALALDMTDLLKQIGPCREDPNWSYVDGPPEGALVAIEETARGLKSIGDSLGERFQSSTSPIMPSSFRAPVGKGLIRALARIDAQKDVSNRNAETAFRKILKPTSVVYDIFARTGTDDTAHWCLLIKVDTLIDFFINCSKVHQALLPDIAASARLVAAPVINSNVCADMAFTLYRFGIVPEPDFAEDWADHLGILIHRSEPVRYLRQIVDAMLSAYGAQAIIGERDLLPEELEFITMSVDRAGDLLEEANALTDKSEADHMGFVLDFVTTLNADIQEAADHNAMLAIINELGWLPDAEEITQRQETFISIIMTIIEEELGVFSSV